MRLSPSSFFCIFITLLGIIRAFQLCFASTKDLRKANEKDIWFTKQQEKTIPTQLVHAGLQNSTLIADSPDNIFYFVQVSDLHISKFQPKGHTIHFLHFLQSALPVVKPEFVVVTGDLIDAKDKTLTVSAQYPEEWQVYKSAVEQGANGTTWYDMRGNHDCFDLVSWQAENNMYRTFGESAKLLDEGKGVYSWEVSKSFGDYNFVAVDSCPKKGPSRPFNFFGYLTTNTMDRLVSKIMPKKYNHTFLFSHYPTTTMVPGKSTEGYKFKDLANYFSIYFCGHLHRLVAGLGDVLKSYNRETDSLELELSDMKDHGSYRIVAIDHDLVSFVDIDLPIEQIPPASEDSIVPLTQNNKIIWPKKIHPAPVVLITNPKDSRYTMPSKEPLQNSRKSSHIRFLVFSEYDPKQLDVKVFMDDKHHPFFATFVGSSNKMPLWTTLWEPNDFDDFETHVLRIEVTAPDGQIGTGQVPFRLDQMRLKIQGGAGEWIIWFSISSLVRFLSIFAISAMLSTMIVPKIYTDYEKNQPGFEEKRNLRNKILYQIHEIDLGLNRSIYASIQKIVYTWIHRFLQFPEEQPGVWYMCFACLIALFSLPWFKAELIPSGKDQYESMGYFYLWGLLFHDDQWVPLADTWMYAIFNLTFNVGLFILFFVWKSTSVHLLYCRGIEKTSSHMSLICDRLWFQSLVMVYWLWRLIGVSDLATFYGGIWPTLIFNLLVWWLFGVAGVIVFGKNGIMAVAISRNKQQSEPLGITLEICPACHDSSEDTDEQLVTANRLFVHHQASTAAQQQLQQSEEEQAQFLQQQIENSIVIPQEEESRRFLFDNESGSDSSSTSNSRRAIRRNASKND